MAEETVVAAPSAAEEPKFTQFDSWDEEGNPVVAKKAESPKPAAAGKPESAESAAADKSKETKSDDAADSAAKKAQEQRQRKDWKDEKRWKELTDRNKQLERELEEARKPKDGKAAESSTAKQPEPKAAEPPPTRPKPTKDALGSDGKKKYASYDDYFEDLALWNAEQLFAKQQRAQQAAELEKGLKQRLDEARVRYPDFDSKAQSIFQELMKPDVPREVFAVIDQSPVLAEQEIAKELGKGKAAAGTKKAGEGEAEPSPETPKPRAPKPPTEVGGRGAPGEDALKSAAKAGNFREFEAEQTRRALDRAR